MSTSIGIASFETGRADYSYQFFAPENAAKLEQVLAAYKELLEQLYKRELNPDLLCSQLQNISQSDSQLLLFLEKDGTIIAMAEASLVMCSPDYNVLISNMVTHELVRRQGYGSYVKKSLLEEALLRWGEKSPKVYGVLTNNKKKGNAGFYQSTGWQTKDTTVWCQLLKEER